MCSGIAVSRHPGECWAQMQEGAIRGMMFPAVSAQQMADAEFFAGEKFEGMETADKGFFARPRDQYRSALSTIICAC